MGPLMMRNPTTQEVLPIKGDLIRHISDSLVVTINKDGSSLSTFGDDIWNYKATSTSLRTINFNSKIELILPVDGGEEASESSFANSKEFLKTFTLHWISAVGGCSMSKLNGDLSGISFLIRYCLDSGIPMREIFSTPNAIDFLIERVSTPKQIGLFLGKIQRITCTSTALSNNPFWAGLKTSVEFDNKLIRARKTYPETSDTVKTLVIPSEIYQSVLKKTIEDLDRFLDHEDSIKYIFSMRALTLDEVRRLDRKLGSDKVSKQSQSSIVSSYWAKLVKKNKKINAVLKKLYEAGISKDETWSGLFSSLTQWQFRSAILIAAFTGMRKSELLAVPLNGLKILSTTNGDIPVVWSTTTKLENNGAPRFTKWVTSYGVEAAFKVAKIISEGVLRWSDDKVIADPKEEDIPLFLSIEDCRNNTPHKCFLFAAATLSHTYIVKELYRSELQVTKQDMNEASWFLYGENIPGRIEIGESWPLTFHQFRRSMAVYAAASGLVSYPALKAQLKHISMIMTMYYTDSNSRALNILGDEAEVKAMRAEWADAKARAEADDLHNLLQSVQPLAGSAGKRLRNQKNRGELPAFMDDRKKTKQAVKNGKIRYRPTLVGGCMSMTPCNKGAGVLASACISCESSVFLVGSKASLEQTKEFYEAQLAEGAPKLARKEYTENIKKIDSFLNNLIETWEVA